jgi:hypothetical protein
LENWVGLIFRTIDEKAGPLTDGELFEVVVATD